MHGVISPHHETPCILHTESHPKNMTILPVLNTTCYLNCNDSMLNISRFSSISCKQNRQKKKQQVSKKDNIQSRLLQFCCPSFILPSDDKYSKSTSTACHTEFLKTWTPQSYIIIAIETLHENNLINYGKQKKSNALKKKTITMNKPSSRTPHTKHRQ